MQENRRKYLIAWEDDEVTGEKFEPTWEPKEYANELAVRDWKERKKSRSGELLTDVFPLRLVTVWEWGADFVLQVQRSELESERLLPKTETRISRVLLALLLARR